MNFIEKIICVVLSGIVAAFSVSAAVQSKQIANEAAATVQQATAILEAEDVMAAYDDVMARIAAIAPGITDAQN